MASLTDEDPDPALMAAMGFSTFGSTAGLYQEPVAKKRRVKSSFSPIPVYMETSKGEGKGANATPLGQRKYGGATHGRGGHGAVIDGSSRGGGAGHTAAAAATVTAVATEGENARLSGGHFEAGVDPDYVDADSDDGDQGAGRTEAVPVPPRPPPPQTTGANPFTRHRVYEGEASLPARPLDGLPVVPPGNDGSRSAQHGQSWTSPSGTVLSAQELAALRRGVRNAEGGTAYFDVSFLEDPWAGMEGVELPGQPAGG